MLDSSAVVTLLVLPALYRVIFAISARHALVALSALSLAVASFSAHAVPFFWTDWTGSDLDAGIGFQSAGTITTPTSSVQVTYTNPNGIGFYQPSGGTDYYTGGSGNTSPYTSALVDNRPTGSDIIALQFAGTQTLQSRRPLRIPYSLLSVSMATAMRSTRISRF